jgi:hypothetical protein
MRLVVSVSGAGRLSSRPVRLSGIALSGRAALGVGLAACVLVAVAFAPSVTGARGIVAAADCQRQIQNGPSVALGATYIAKYEGMTCHFARKVVLTADRRHGFDKYAKPLYGLRCHHVNINAGGGEEVCRSQHRLLELLFE